MSLKRTLVLTSGLACALAVALWFSTLLIGFSHRIQWGENPFNAIDLCACDDGIVVAFRANDSLDVEPANRGTRHAVNARANQPDHFFLGVGYFQIRDYSVYILPFWILIAATLIAPARTVWRTGRRNRRIAASLCLQCRYDLRMHRPGDRCPECGTFICETSLPSFPVQLQEAA